MANTVINIPGTIQFTFQSPVTGALCLSINWQLDPAKKYRLGITLGTATGIIDLGGFNLPPGTTSFNFTLDTTKGMVPAITEIA